MADQLDEYKNKQCVVVALNGGGVIVGAQIAMRLHSSLVLLANESITIPGELNPIATMTSHTFTYNQDFSQGQIDEFSSEYRGFIEGARIEKFHRLNHLYDDSGEVDRKFLRNHVVIVVADALNGGSQLDVASDFLKPIKTTKLVVVTPLADVKAVDKMHLLGDDIYCMSVVENLMDVDHYYDDNNVPNTEEILKIIRNISLNWNHPG